MNPFVWTGVTLAESEQKAISSQMKRNLLSPSSGKNILLVTIQDEMLATQQYTQQESLSAFSWGTIPAQVGYHLCPVGLEFLAPMLPCFYFKHVPWERSNLRGMKKKKWLLHQCPCLSLGLGSFFPFPMFIFNLFLFIWLHWELVAACTL